MLRPPPTSTLFPYTTLFRSCDQYPLPACTSRTGPLHAPNSNRICAPIPAGLPVGPFSRTRRPAWPPTLRSEEHTSELQSHHDLVCRLLLEKKKKKKKKTQKKTKQKKTRKPEGKHTN